MITRVCSHVRRLETDPRAASSRTTAGWASLRPLIIALGLTMMGAHGAAALDEPKDEWPRLKACEKDLCAMVLGKSDKGPDLSCALSKTWAQDSLNGGKGKGVSWMFGDARCTTTVNLSRADIVGALTQPKYTIQIPEQAVKCVVERSGEAKPVTMKLAPKLVFKNGKADKVWINLNEIDGPEDVKGTVWTAANLEDTLGLFHKPMIRSINKFLYQRCEKKYGPNAKPDEDESTAKAAPPPTKKSTPGAEAASTSGAPSPARPAKADAGKTAEKKAAEPKAPAAAATAAPTPATAQASGRAPAPN